MASLYETVKSGGQLQSAAQPDISGLAAASGQAMNPTQPLTAATLGATPAQAAASGAPNALAGAVRSMRMDARGQADLGTALRTQQVQGAQSPAQAAATAAARGLSQVPGSMASRVNAIVAQDYSAAAAGSAAPGVQPSLVADATKLAPYGLDAATQAAVVADLNKAGSASASQADKDAAYADAANKLGGAGGPHLGAAEMQSLFMDTGTTLGAALAGKTPADVTVGQLQPSDLGVKDFSDLDTLLGVQPGATTNMTVQQLTDAVQAKQTGAYSSAEQWRGILADPTSSTALRATARTMLQGMGQTGALATEDAVRSLTHQVQAANTVTFAGQSMSIQAALSSDTIKGTVAHMLQDPAYAASVAATPGMEGFAKWVQGNADALHAATAGIGVEAQHVATTSTANDAQYAGLTDPALRKALSNGTYGTAVSAVTQPPALVAGLAKATADQAALVNNVLSAQDISGSPDALKAVTGMTVAQVTQVFPTSAALDSFQKGYQGAGSAASPAAMSAALLQDSGFSSLDAVSNWAQGMLTLKGGGVAVPPATLAALHVLAPGGVLLSGKDLQGQLSRAFPPMSTADALAAGYAPASPGQELSDAAKALDPSKVSNQALGDIAGMLARTGTTDWGTIQDRSLAAANTGSMVYLNNAYVVATKQSQAADAATAKAGRAAMTALEEAQASAVSNVTASALQTSGYGGRNAATFEADVTANADAQTASVYVTQATAAFNSARSAKADSSITDSLSRLVTLAQARQADVDASTEAARQAALQQQIGGGSGSTTHDTSVISKTKAGISNIQNGRFHL